MFVPVSPIAYAVIDADRQILVCTLGADPALGLEKWQSRATALFADGDVGDVVRDILANPQIRALVFDGPGDPSKFYAFWQGVQPLPGYDITDAHLALVRQFVSLYDGDCWFKKAAQPFWPERLRYLSKEPP